MQVPLRWPRKDGGPKVRQGPCPGRVYTGGQTTRTTNKQQEAKEAEILYSEGT